VRDELADLLYRANENRLALAEARADVQRHAEILKAHSDRSQRTVAATSLWFLSSALAGNIAGIWALLGKSEIDHRSLFWAMMWFSLGVVVSFIAGAWRLRRSNERDLRFSSWAQNAIMLSTDGADRSKNPSGIDPKSLASLTNYVDLIWEIFLGVTPIFLFMMGSGVAVYSRLYN
jgi:hypothetical protein